MVGDRHRTLPQLIGPGGNLFRPGRSIQKGKLQVLMEIDLLAHWRGASSVSRMDEKSVCVEGATTGGAAWLWREVPGRLG
ncbi:MAG TPA: hypothetical protein PK181_09385, partial [Methanothrix soehngenii]|nr:hypothetical protein [Methanothrix soehngenii]